MILHYLLSGDVRHYNPPPYILSQSHSSLDIIDTQFYFFIRPTFSKKKKKTLIMLLYKPFIYDSSPLTLWVLLSIFLGSTSAFLS